MTRPAPDIGVFLPSMSAPGELPGDIATAARHAEGLGLESAWVVDQLVAGTGAPLLDSGIALGAAAGATARIRLGFGVMILPLHPLVWAAKQVASLQHVSGGRLILGVGAGGDRHDRSWAAAGVPRRERGARTDAALRALPSLVAGKATRPDDRADGPTVQLAPEATMPPVLVGGMSDAALARAVEFGDGWFALPGSPEGLREARERLAALAAERGRTPPQVTTGLMTAISGDPALPDRDALIRMLTDPDGVFGLPDDQAPSLVATGGPAEIADRLAAYAGAGTARVVVTVAAGDWRRQTDLLAEAHALLT